MQVNANNVDGLNSTYMETSRKSGSSEVFTTPPVKAVIREPPSVRNTAIESTVSQISLPLDRNHDIFSKNDLRIMEIDLSKFYEGMPEHGRYCTVIDGIIRQDEAEQWIKCSEECGYEEALLNGTSFKDIRNSSRSIIDDHNAAIILYERIFKVLRNNDIKRERWEGTRNGESDVISQETYRYDENGPPFILSGKYSALGVNERFRFLKYSAGQYFKPHFDGTYKRPDGRSRSMVTIQIYLNEGMEGGTTTILSPSITGETYKEDDVIARVVPKVGRILLFDHNTMHEGSLLTKGVKYTVRTEIMYDIPHDE